MKTYEVTLKFHNPIKVLVKAQNIEQADTNARRMEDALYTGIESEVVEVRR